LNHVGSGSIAISGAATAVTSGSAVNYAFMPSGGFVLDGSGDTNFTAEYDIETAGGVVASGEADVVCPNYAYESIVNFIASGTASVLSSRYTHIGSGNLTTGGGASFGVGVEGSGTISVGGTATTLLGLPFIASGSFSIDGSAVTSIFHIIIQHRAVWSLMGQQI